MLLFQYGAYFYSICVVDHYYNLILSSFVAHYSKAIFTKCYISLIKIRGFFQLFQLVISHNHKCSYNPLKYTVQNKVILLQMYSVTFNINNTNIFKGITQSKTFFVTKYMCHIYKFWDQLATLMVSHPHHSNVHV